MEKHFILVLLLLLLCSLSLAVGSDQYDDKQYWKKRRQEAILRSSKAYRPDYYNVTNYLNSRARKMLENEGMSNSRRMLTTRKHYSSCEITNPMDACWRCHDNWDRHRTELAKCALGFAKGTTGGAGGRMYVVTDPSDDDVVNPKPGTLRHAVIQDKPLWITFKKCMTIRLKQELIMNSDKTIDGRGANVVIEHGPGITIHYVNNIIIQGIEFRNIVTGPGGLIRDSVKHYGYRNVSHGNAISIYGSQRVWIDHCSFANCFHKFIEIQDAATAITISNCRMDSQDEVFVFGAQDEYELDEMMEVTIAYNHFGEKLVKNMPRCSNGFCHVVNNDYTGWKHYVITGRANVTIMSQGNRYTAPDDPKAKEITNRKGVPIIKSGTWAQEKDIHLNGAFFEPSGRLLHNPHKQRKLRAMPGIMAAVMTRQAGPLNCLPKKPC